MRIRVARASDIDEIVRIERASFKHPYSIYYFLILLRQNPNNFLIAEEGGKVLGYAVGEVFHDFSYIDSIAVDPLFRRRGIGKRLLHHLLELFKSRGAKKVKLHVRVSNQVAQKFYEGFGFRCKQVVRNYYDEEDALLYEKDL